MQIGIEISRFLDDEKIAIPRYVRYLLTYAPGLDQTIQYNLFSPGPLELPPEIAKHPNVKTRLASPWGGLYQKRLWEQITLPLALKKWKIDVYHSLDYVLPVSVPCASIVTIHDISYSTHPEWMPPFKTLYKRILSRLGARKAWRVVTISNFSRDELVAHYKVPKEKISVIPLSGDEMVQRAVEPCEIERTKRKYGLQGPFLLNVGAVHQRRNLPKMIESLQLARKTTGLDLKLVVVGPNHHYPPLDLTDYLRKQAPEGEVVYVGWIPDLELTSLYQGASALLYISLYEGMGLPLIEAMKSGLPLVASNCSAIPEVAGDAALLVDPNNSQEIAESVIRVITDQALRVSLIDRGRKQAQKFSWRKTAERTVELYQRYRSSGSRTSGGRS